MADDLFMDDEGLLVGTSVDSYCDEVLRDPEKVRQYSPTILDYAMREFGVVTYEKSNAGGGEEDLV
jgi:hypothetical protein